MSNRRRDRERRKRLAHAEPVERTERAPRPERAAKPTQKGGGGRSSSRRPAPAPSLQRSLKRGGLVLVVLSVVIYVVDKGKHQPLADVAQAAVGAILFVPFDFLLTRFTYDRINKRYGS
jgi:Flp pilus assembly protein TadB